MEALDYVLDVAEGKRERLDCATCERGEAACGVCPIDEVPERLGEASFWVQLYRRCQHYRTLPRGGGVLDQDLRTLAMFDRIAALDESRRKYAEQLAKARGGR